MDKNISEINLANEGSGSAYCEGRIQSRQKYSNK